MANYFGLVQCCDSFGKPMNLEVQVLSLGKFKKVGGMIRDYIADKLSEHGLYTFRTAYSSIHEPGGDKKHYSDGDGDVLGRCHEECHERFDKTEFADEDIYNGNAYTYFQILNESYPKAFEYNLLLKNPGIKNAKKMIEAYETYSIWGKRAYNLSSKVISSDDPKMNEEEVKRFIAKSFCTHTDYNWLALLFETKYFGLLRPCLDMISDCDNPDERMHVACNNLIQDPTGDKFLSYLNAFTYDKRESTGILFEKLVQKSLLSYKNGEDKLNLTFHAPFGFNLNDDSNYLIKIGEDTYNTFKKELDNLGELQVKIWSNKIVLAR